MLFRGSERFNLPFAILDTINCYITLPFLKWNKWILTFNFANAFWLWVLKRDSTLGKGDKCTQYREYEEC